MVAYKSHGHLQQAQNDQPDGCGNQTLTPMPCRPTLAQLLDSRSEPTPNQNPQREHEPRRVSEIKSSAPVTESDGFRQLVRRHPAKWDSGESQQVSGSQCET